MTIGLIFWMLMIIWAIFAWSPGIFGTHPWAPTLLLFILLFLLGWHDFGFVVHQ